MKPAHCSLRRRLLVGLGFVALCLPVAQHETTALAADQWRYIVGADASRPVATTLPLTDEPPEDIREEIEYHGVRQRYGEIRYGSKNSRRVTVVVDDLGEDGLAFFVDTDRDRVVTDDERLPGSGRTRRVELHAEIMHGDQPIQARRMVELRLGVTKTRLSVATLGFVEGTIQGLQGEAEAARLAVRRIDADANGLFADSRDRLQIDLNRDGNYDLLSEQFPWLPMQTIAGNRYAVHADRLGERLELSEIHGTGEIQIVASNLAEDVEVAAFEAMVFAEDASAYSLERLGQPLEVPVGRYALGSVTITLRSGDGRPWHFVFSRTGDIGEKAWFSVEAGQTVAREAVGRFSFTLHADDDGRTRPGDMIVVNPRMHSEDGLLINLSCRGDRIGSFDNERAHNRCTLTLVTPEGEVLTSAQSGFA